VISVSADLARGHFIAVALRGRRATNTVRLRALEARLSAPLLSVRRSCSSRTELYFAMALGNVNALRPLRLRTANGERAEDVHGHYRQHAEAWYDNRRSKAHGRLAQQAVRSTNGGVTTATAELRTSQSKLRGRESFGEGGRRGLPRPGRRDRDRGPRRRRADALLHARPRPRSRDPNALGACRAIVTARQRGKSMREICRMLDA
jgi:hypothetical protein